MRKKKNQMARWCTNKHWIILTKNLFEVKRKYKKWFLCCSRWPERIQMGGSIKFCSHITFQWQLSWNTLLVASHSQTELISKRLTDSWTSCKIFYFCNSRFTAQFDSSCWVMNVLMNHKNGYKRIATQCLVKTNYISTSKGQSAWQMVVRNRKVL